MFLAVSVRKCCFRTLPGGLKKICCFQCSIVTELFLLRKAVCVVERMLNLIGEPWFKSNSVTKVRKISNT